LTKLQDETQDIVPEKLEGLATTTNLGVFISSDNGETGKLSLELRFVLDEPQRMCPCLLYRYCM
jgi:hypothetical protein